MRNFFIKSTVETDFGKSAGVSVREGTFDNTGIEDSVADMIVMAQVSTYTFQFCEFPSACPGEDEEKNG